MQRQIPLGRAFSCTAPFSQLFSCAQRISECLRRYVYFKSRLTGNAAAGNAYNVADMACRRRQKKYESPQSTPEPAAQPHASGPSPTEKWAMSAEARSMAKPA